MASTHDVIANITKAMTIVFDTLLCFLFEANLLAGKTELILRIAGPNAATLKRKLKTDNMVLRFPSCIGEQAVRVVNRYQHLGVSTSAGCSHTGERPPLQSLAPLRPSVSITRELMCRRRCPLLGHIFSRDYFSGQVGGMNSLSTSSRQSLLPRCTFGGERRVRRTSTERTIICVLLQIKKLCSSMSSWSPVR